jgi:hypothetical protein
MTSENGVAPTARHRCSRPVAGTVVDDGQRHPFVDGVHEFDLRDLDLADRDDRDLPVGAAGAASGWGSGSVRSRAPTNAATRIDRVRRSRPFRSARGTDEWSAPANGNVWFAGEAERPALGSQPLDADPVARAAVIAALGHRRSLTADEVAIARAATADASAAVRAAAVAALVRAAPVRAANSAWQRATRDTEARVRRRAADLAPALAARRRRPDPAIADHLVAQLADPEVTVVEAAAWALGEIPRLDDGPIVAALAEVVTGHRDALAREAAVASLGAIGDPRGLAAVLTATNDKPPVRRRAVLALAPFEGAAVDAALARALEDRDWQVRQAAEDLGASP